MSNRFILGVLFLPCLFACDLKPKAGTEPSLEKFGYHRHYQTGEVFAYEVTSNVYLNQQWAKEEVARTLHRVVAARGWEKVGWESLRLRNDSGFFNLDADARKVAPYDLSLIDNGKLDIPSTAHVPTMSGVVNDLGLFYLSISPAIGLPKVQKVGDSYTRPKLWQGKWGERNEEIKGENCFESQVEITAIGTERVAVRSSFLSPSKGCLSAKKDWMAAPVATGTLNNFQEVRKETNGTYTVRWGSEEWTVQSQIERRTGKLAVGSLASSISLKIRRGCDAELEKCTSEPVAQRIDRSTQLALRP